MRERPAVVGWLGAFVLVLAFGGPGRADLRAFERAWSEARGEASKIEALKLLEADGSEKAARILLQIALAPDEPAAVAMAAVARLAALENTEADRWIVREAREARRWQQRAALVRAIAMRGSEAATAPLLAALEDRAWQVRVAALPGLARRPRPEVVEALVRALERLAPRASESPRVRAEIEDTLFRLTGQRLEGAKAWRGWWEANRDGWRPPTDGGQLVEHDEATVSRSPRLFPAAERLSERIVFVIDISGSMRVRTPAGLGEGPGGEGPTRFERMVAELKRVIDRLPARAAFNIVAFSDEPQPWARKLQRVSARSRKAAKAFLDRLEPKGQTNVIGALERAFADPQLDTIVLLSDGYPTAGRTIDMDKISAELARWNLTRGVRVHTVAFLSGDGRSLGIVEDKASARAFMEKLARDHGGRCRIIE